MRKKKKACKRIKTAVHTWLLTCDTFDVQLKGE